MSEIGENPAKTRAFYLRWGGLFVYYIIYNNNLVNRILCITYRFIILISKINIKKMTSTDINMLSNPVVFTMFTRCLQLTGVSIKYYR